MSNTSKYGHYSGGKAGSSGGSTAGRYPSRRRLDNGGWSWHDCHQHWHYDNYAHYALRKLCTNEDVAWEDRPVVGHKNGWCAAIIYHSMVRHAVHSPIPYCDAFIGV